jgi:hypothetical protein
MLFSGMWRHAVLVWPPAHAGSSLTDFSILKMEAIPSSDTSVHTRTIWRHIPENGILHSHRCENLKSYMTYVIHILCAQQSVDSFCINLVWIMALQNESSVENTVHKSLK